jgi:hypothetical protein
MGTFPVPQSSADRVAVVDSSRARAWRSCHPDGPRANS